MSSTTIFDSQGRVKYQIINTSSGKTVLNTQGKVIGSIRDGKTFDSKGSIVSYGEDISALTS